MKTGLLLILLGISSMGCIPEGFKIDLEGGTENRVIILNCLNPQSEEEAAVCGVSVPEPDCGNPRNEEEAQFCNGGVQ